MKVESIVICVLLVLISINLSGCDELEHEDSFIYVVVSAITRVSAKAPSSDIFNGTLIKDLLGLEVEMEILKSGAAKKTQSFTTGELGETQHIYHTVKVYKEQNVRVKAYLRSVLPQDLIDYGFSIETFKYEELPWSVIYSSTDWGGTYYWYPIVYF